MPMQGARHSQPETLSYSESDPPSQAAAQRLALAVPSLQMSKRSDSDHNV